MITLGVSCSVLWMTLYAVSTLAKEKEKITVTTIEGAPWVKPKKNRTESDNFEGFIPDLLQMVADHASISYKLKLVNDGNYGQRQKNNQWNGMIGEILSGKADLAAAALTISNERSEVIEFTDPFRTFTSAVVLLKSPGGSRAPISSVKDLSNQTSISVGVIKGGETEAFFYRATDLPLKQIADRMRADPTLLVRTNEEGIAKVRRSGGKYAFIMEAPTAEYLAMTSPCDLEQVNLNLEPRSYAWGVKIDSPLRDPINRAFKALKDNGDLFNLELKWRNPGECSMAAQRFEPAPLQFAFLLLTAAVSSRSL